ncbi:efflux RND transporter periplasmic adaptor subunit [Azoarcus sp. DN11]|uniref:efflux RND transporter periplasmic adaptor subunit n=1 Tax=Azoarcus sp. DN11 TaxID=356837 RepID=UPI000EAD4137|nr:efflux RND transporter periplasmic adaptor subunit [Azoarcus sp. DN11]AYH43980.1 efflux transporter periplasmic adaptor subunit [Azoarcus sp. DN11]
MDFSQGKRRLGVAAVAVLLGSGTYLWAGHNGQGAIAAQQPLETAKPSSIPAEESILLTDAQLKSVSIQAVDEREFAVDKEAVGNIDFNQDMTVQVSPPYQGRVVQLFAKTGDKVEKGKPLFVIDSPDLVQAESTLIASAGVLKLTTSALNRAKALYEVQGIAEKDYQQVVSDQQTAEGAFKAARDAVKIFGKSESEIDRIVQERRIDAHMPVASPIHGQVTARNAAPGTLVQPGGTPAPYTVADLSTKWMLASVPEADLPFMRLGQEVDVRLQAYPGRIFHGKISNIGATVDPSTHRVTIRSEVRDPKNELLPQMFATFIVRTGESVRGPAVPVSGVVREGDGTMTVWVTTDRRRFTARSVKLGVQRDGVDQIVDGLKAGELVAADGALFLSNARILGAK